MVRRSEPATEEIQLRPVTRRGRNRQIEVAEAFGESPEMRTGRNLEVATVENEIQNVSRKNIDELTLTTLETEAFFTRRVGANGGTEARVEIYEPITRRGTHEVTVATIKNYVNRVEEYRVLSVATLENENPGRKSNINPALIGPNPPLRRTANGAVTFSSLDPRVLVEGLPSVE